MADNDSGSVHGSTDGGVAGQHNAAETPRLVVGATTTDQLNTIILRLAPVACFKVEDIRFAFDSSFLLSDPTDEKKDIRAELKLLADLRLANPESPLSVFGHADPVGEDPYNKQLSGRRATVVYALLIFNSEPDAAVKLWQDIAQQEHWGDNQNRAMQDFTGLPAGTGAATLIKAYMQKLSPPELKITKKDFVAQGTDPKGKGDYQGCSEFNPLLIFSEKRQQEFDSDRDKTARNDANATNRRVMVLLFQKGTKVEPSKWPCPRASEGPGVCYTRFWAQGPGSESGDRRRKRRDRDQDRKFEDNKDTFACRFYQRLTDKSPCEGALTLVKIRLFDPQARPLPFAPCLITEAGGTPKADRATGAAPGGSPPSTAAPEDGLIFLRVKSLPTTVNLKWSRAKAKETAAAPRVFTDKEKEINGYKYEFDMDVTIDIPEADQQAASLPRLKNLGYVKPPNQTPDVEGFQQDYKAKFSDINQDGTLNPPTVNAIRSTHENTDPVLKKGADIPLRR